MCGKIPDYKSKPRNPRYKGNLRHTKHVDLEDSPESCQEDSDESSNLQLDSLRVLKINKVSADAFSEPWFVNLKIENTNLKLELDCGTPTTVLPISWYEKYFSHVEIIKPKEDIINLVKRVH